MLGVFFLFVYLVGWVSLGSGDVICGIRVGVSTADGHVCMCERLADVRRKWVLYL
ncbi:hypothetical protein M758_4G047400 [Ceratodon purpureus]|nr:hypothetical protein M758_4G047400 [Ceratodon purpureus]